MNSPQRPKTPETSKTPEIGLDKPVPMEIEGEEYYDHLKKLPTVPSVIKVEE